MSELSPKTRDALLRVGTSTLTGVLNRRGLRTMFMQDVWPIRHDIPRMVGVAFTMRFIPSREDKDGPGARGRGQIQSQAMETCPPGHVLVVDSRGDPRAASAGDLYVGRLKARGYAGTKAGWRCDCSPGDRPQPARAGWCCRKCRRPTGQSSCRPCPTDCRRS